MKIKFRNIINICVRGIFFLSTLNCASHKPDTGRKLIWNDEFNGKGLPDSLKWNYDTGGSGFEMKKLSFIPKTGLKMPEWKKEIS